MVNDAVSGINHYSLIMQNNILEKRDRTIAFYLTV